MTLFVLLKVLHMSCAMVSVAGFALRGYWALADDPRRQRRFVRIAPHVIDTLLLVSALGMLALWRISPLVLPWVMAKLVGLVVYILLGLVTLRFARSRRGRLVAYVAALGTAAYIFTVAFAHSPLGPLAFSAH